MYERNGNTKGVYKYDEKLGYQYPVGKNIKGKVKIPTNLKKRKTCENWTVLVFVQSVLLRLIFFNVKPCFVVKPWAFIPYERSRIKYKTKSIVDTIIKIVIFSLSFFKEIFLMIYPTYIKSYSEMTTMDV